MSISPLQAARAEYRPKLPAVLAANGPCVGIETGEATTSVADPDAIQAMFPNTYGMPVVQFAGQASPVRVDGIKVGVILSGGQAPGGHNVIAGLHDGLKALHAGNELYGFLDGPSGLIKNQARLIDDAFMGAYRNTGGFDIIGSGRTKLESEEQFADVVANCQERGISAIVVIGGDDSNTNACVLAEYCLREQTGLQVIGCPKTIDGDLKNAWIETSFGFDTACKVYSELIGNIQRDAASSKKYWYFIKLMGRSASHIALECALQTHANVCLISEEVAAKQQTLAGIVDDLATVIAARAADGKNYGVALVPEGLIEFIPEMRVLIDELNELLADDEGDAPAAVEDRLQKVLANLSEQSAPVFRQLPDSIQRQLLADRDPHGNVQVSRIETEKLLIEMLGERLRAWKAEGRYDGKWSTQAHFFGYEGRCAAPSNFDADYCYGLGYSAATLIGAGKTGYLASLRGLTKPAAEWIPGGIPMTMMMNLERRHGADKPVIRKALVELSGKPFAAFSSRRDAWAAGEDYVYPGPIQYFGPSSVCDLVTHTLSLELDS